MKYALVVGVLLGACGRQSNRENASPAPAVQAEVTAPAEQLAAEPSPSDLVPIPAATAADYRYTMAQSFELGDFSYEVTQKSVEIRVGRRPLMITAADGARFVVVRFRETNNGNETATVMASQMKLEDEAGRRFAPSSQAMAAIAMSESRGNLIAAELQPGLTHASSVVFEAPAPVADQAGLVLLVPQRGLLGRQEARVLLVSATTLAHIQVLRAEQLVLQKLVAGDRDAALRTMLPQDRTAMSAHERWWDCPRAFAAAEGAHDSRAVELEGDIATIVTRKWQGGRWRSERDPEMRTIARRHEDHFRFVRWECRNLGPADSGG